MTMNERLGALAIAALVLGACSKDDGSGEGSGEEESTGGGEGTTDTTAGSMTTTTGVDESTGGGGACNGAGIGTAADGDPCTANEDCASGVCTIFTDAPLNEDAVCAPTPAGCNMRITGTVFDFATRTPVAGAEVIVANALEAATSPTTATPRAMATSGADGRIDVTTEMPFSAALGVVALIGGGDNYLTATGLAAPVDGGTEYEVGNGNHDLWVVAAADLTAWSDALAMDPDVDPARLPLGENGGVIGLVRDTTGAPVAGAQVVPTSDTSMAFIRYLAEDGTFTADMTSATGNFVILGPGLGETFTVQVGGMDVSGEGTAGSTNDAAFTLVMTVQQ